MCVCGGGGGVLTVSALRSEAADLALPRCNTMLCAMTSWLGKTSDQNCVNAA